MGARRVVIRRNDQFGEAVQQCVLLVVEEAEFVSGGGLRQGDQLPAGNLDPLGRDAGGHQFQHCASFHAVFSLPRHKLGMLCFYNSPVFIWFTI